MDEARALADAYEAGEARVRVHEAASMPVPWTIRQHAAVTPASTTVDVSRGLPAQILGRFLSNLGFRLVFPFLPTIARGLDTSLGTVGVALSLRELTGLAGLPLGAAMDRGRHRTAMVLALLGFAAGCLLAGMAPGIVAFSLAMAISGVSKLAYDTAMGAWIGEHVPFAQRGRIVGITELSWAASFLVGMPLVAVAIDRSGWRTPFTLLAVANAAAAVAVGTTLARDRPRSGGRRPLLTRPVPGVLPLVVSVAAVVLGHQLVLVSFGAWFEDGFGLDVGGLGALAVVLGLAELIGTGLTVAFTDRLGKRRSMALGALVIVPAVAAFGLVGSTVAATVAVGVALLGFEFSFISALPYATEIDPSARGATLGLLLSAATCTRAVGSVLGTWLYDARGIGWVGAVAAAATAVGVVVILVRGREPGGA
jgi:MFS transporter, DHA1 family, inner membrane transport protein